MRNELGIPVDQDVQIPSTTSNASMVILPDVTMPSVSSSTFTAPRTTRIAKSNAQKQREYRQRKAAERPIKVPKSRAQIQREYRQRQAAKRTAKVRKSRADIQRDYRQRQAANCALEKGTM